MFFSFEMPSSSSERVFRACVSLLCSHVWTTYGPRVALLVLISTVNGQLVVRIAVQKSKLARTLGTEVSAEASVHKGEKHMRGKPFRMNCLASQRKKTCSLKKNNVLKRCFKRLF